jgi:hypothetical protein
LSIDDVTALLSVSMQQLVEAVGAQGRRHADYWAADLRSDQFDCQYFTQ